MARRKDKASKSDQLESPTAARQPKDWQWCLFAMAVPMALCATKLNLDLWSDEAYTLIFFVSKPFLQIATDYSAPNNHVFYSLLLRPFYLISDSNFVLRLPSLAFTAGTLVMVFRLVRRWSSPTAAVAATLTLGLTQTFLIFTMQVRGYGLSMFLAAWLAELSLRETPRRGQRVAVLLGGAALLYVLPTNLLFAAPLAAVAVAWTAMRDRSWRQAAIMAAIWAGAFAIGGLLYLPIADQVLAARGAPVPSPFWPTVSLARQVFSTATRDWLSLLPLVPLGLLAWVTRIRQGRSTKDAALPLLIAAMLLGPFVLTAFLGIRPFLRNYCPLLPFLAIGIGWPLAELAAAVGRLLRSRRNPAADAATVMAVLAVVALPKILTYPGRLTEYRRDHFAQDGYYDYYAANFHPADVVAFLQLALREDRSYLVCFSDADHFSLVHYFSRAGMPWQQTVAGSPTVVYAITPPQADYEALSAKFGIPADTFRRMPVVRDFGYYRLSQLPQPVPVQP